MSPDALPGSATLIAIGKAGVEIRLYDSNFELLASGTGTLERQLPEGLYAIEWVAGDVRSQDLVRLSASPVPHEVHYRRAGEADVAQSQKAWIAPSLLQSVGRELRPSERAYESSVAVIVTASGAVSPRDVLKDIRILGRGRKALRANSDDNPQFALASGDAARCYRVRPGRYVVQFKSVTGESLQQSVPALAGRQTIIFLNAGVTEMLTVEGQSFVRTKSVGVDPARTVMISVAGDEEEERIRERVRLAGILLDNLARGTSSLAREFVEILDQDRTDPLLKIYAGSLVLSQLEAGRSPAARAWPEAKARAEGFASYWARKALSWIPDPRTEGIPTDAVTALWEMLDAHPRLWRRRPFDNPPKQIQVPPMLQCAWRWAIEQSFRDPNAVKGRQTIVAASRSLTGAAPWLCWRAAALKGAPAPGSRVSEESIERSIETVQRRAKNLLARHGGSAVAILDRLSPDAAATTLLLSQSRLGRPPEDRALHLALTVNMPNVQLRRHLAEVANELEKALQEPPIAGPEREARFGLQQSIEQREKPSESVGGSANRRRLSALAQLAPLDTPAPALSRRIQDVDDPQRGRFGKEASRDGFRLSARFEETSARNWVRILLKVTGPAGPEEIAEFFVHDSFNPSQFERRFKNRKAELTLTAWGGFTVGVWIPSRQIELELDLAKIKRAPRIIRTR